jgi:hypothetical protein
VLKQLIDLSKVLLAPEHPFSKTMLQPESNPRYPELQHTIQTISNLNNTLLRTLSEVDPNTLMGLLLNGPSFGNMVRMKMGLEFGFLLGAAFQLDQTLFDGLFKAVMEVQDYLGTLSDDELEELGEPGAGDSEGLLSLGSKLVQ